VLGLGYIGLPTALLLARAGHTVVGVDIKPAIVDQLQKGTLPFQEPGLEELYKAARDHFSATAELSSSDVYIIAVPTPVEKGLKMAELSMVRKAAETIAHVIKENQLVILESTVPPGTSEHLVLPLLRRNGVSSLFYVHCPERAIPGKTLYEMVHNTRIIGGLDSESATKAKDLYSSFVKGEIILSDMRTAEFVKLMENTFRDINIALANEFSLMAEEYQVNIWKAIDLANKHPRVTILKPGPGVGGHCIAVDPLFLVEKSGKSRIVSLAREINDSMPVYVMKLANELLKKTVNPTITLLGLAYKGNVDDMRESPSFKLKKIAESEGIIVKCYDPLVKHYEENASSLEEATRDSDCLIVVTDHDVFTQIDPHALPIRQKNVIDTRNILNHKTWRDAGYKVRILGVAEPAL